MATGIVSIAAADHGFHRISDVLIVVAAVLFAALTIAAIVRLRPDLDNLDVPLQLLTFVAACAVVGTRLHSSPLARSDCSAGCGFWRLAVRGCGGIGGRAARPRAWRLGICGRCDIGAGDPRRGPRLPTAAIALLALALCLYGAMTGLVVWRVFHEPSAADLCQPDIWILMGGVAIATLAGDHISSRRSADSAGNRRDVGRRQRVDTATGRGECAGSRR